MEEFGNIKTEQYKGEPLSMAMASVPVFQPRPMTGTVNPFQNPAMTSPYGFNMDGSLGYTSNLYNPPPPHLQNAAKMSARSTDVEARHLSHSFTKQHPIIYHNFTPLSSCNIVTTNGFFNLNASSDISKHSFEEVLNLPSNFTTESPVNAQIMMPKTHYHEPATSVMSDIAQYSQEPINSYLHSINSGPHELQMPEPKKHPRSHKVLPKSVIANGVLVNNVAHGHAVENNCPLNNDVAEDVNIADGELMASTDIQSTLLTGKNLYKCGFCELKVSSSETLLEHLNTHPNLLPYHCGICGMAFIECSQLMNHVQHSHILKPPYGCGLCASAFHQSEELKEHIESHDKPTSINNTKLPPAILIREIITATDNSDENLKQEDTELDGEDEEEGGPENFDSSSVQDSNAASTIIIGKDTNFSLRKGPSKIVMDDVDLNSVCTVIVEPSKAGGIRKKHLFKCNYCEKVCKDKGSLVSHVRTHTKGRPYECNICYAKFKQYAHLSDHVMTKHTKERPYVCDRCAKTFNRKSHLQDHIRLRHTEDKMYHCSECSAMFQKRTEYSEHKRTHSKPPKYQCNLCPRQFRNVTDYERHIRSHTKEKRYECEVCHLTFGLLANAKKHMIKHNEERPFKCEICPKAYHFEHDFKRHKLTHLKKKPFPCPDCYKSFKNASLLKKHAKETHMGSDEDPVKKPFKCVTCKKRFKIQWDLDRHRKIHAKKKPFPCLYCYKSYGSEAMMTKHVKVHDGQNLPPYDHTKDLIEESETDTKIKKCGRKPRLKTESESREQTNSYEVKKPKRRGRPPKQKRDSDSEPVSMLKRHGRLPKNRSDSETDEQSAPSIKVTFRRNKLSKHKFPCPDCSKAFMSKAMLKRHSRIHVAEDDESEDDDDFPHSESTNDGASFHENTKAIISLKELTNKKNHHSFYGKAGDHVNFSDEEMTEDDEHNSTSDVDGSYTAEVNAVHKKAKVIRRGNRLARFSQVNKHQKH